MDINRTTAIEKEKQLFSIRDNKIKENTKTKRIVSADGENIFILHQKAKIVITKYTMIHHKSITK